MITRLLKFSVNRWACKVCKDFVCRTSKFIYALFGEYFSSAFHLNFYLSRIERMLRIRDKVLLEKEAMDQFVKERCMVIYDRIILTIPFSTLPEVISTLFYIRERCLSRVRWPRKAYYSLSVCSPTALLMSVA